MLAITSLLFSGCHCLENRFIYAPDRCIDDWTAASDLAIEEAWFRSADQTLLNGLLVSHPEARATILFAHGRSGNITSPLDCLFDFVRRHRVSVLIFDYRGYGKSHGKPDEVGLYADARAARRWLANRTGTNESEIVLMGRSLGAAVVTKLAAEDGAKGLIIESGFTSLADVVKHHAPMVPAKRILVSKFDSVNNLSAYPGPVMISHGTADEVIPYSQGVGLFLAATGARQFFQIPGGRHDWRPCTRYQAALDQFISDIESR